MGYSVGEKLSWEELSLNRILIGAVIGTGTGHWIVDIIGN